MKRACSVVTLTALLATSAPAAWGQPSEAEKAARQHFRLGETHYAAGQFARALTEYEVGYGAVPLPGFLVNMAQCHRRLGQLSEARTAYRKFVLVAPDSPLVPEVRGLISELDRLVEPDESADPDAPAAPEWAAENAGSANEGLRASPNLRAPSPPLPTPSPSLLLAGTSTVATASATSRSPAVAPARSVFSRWWFWGALAAVTVGGVVTVMATSRGSSDTFHDGTLGTLGR